MLPRKGWTVGHGSSPLWRHYCDELRIPKEGEDCGAIALVFPGGRYFASRSMARPATPILASWQQRAHPARHGQKMGSGTMTTAHTGTARAHRLLAHRPLHGTWGVGDAAGLNWNGTTQQVPWLQQHPLLWFITWELCSSGRGSELYPGGLALKPCTSL